MKKFDLNESRVNVQSGTINYISTDKLKTYLTIADKSLSAESKAVINWLIKHPNYVTELGSANASNALASFIDRNSPKNNDEKVLLNNCNKVIKNDSLLEIPNFQTEEQFESIISGKVLPDMIILDLKSEKGRNKILKKFEPMLHKICADPKYANASSLTFEDLYSSALEHLVNAMNAYGKKESDSVDGNKSTFMNFAYTYIRNGIIDEIRQNGRTVRTAVSDQKREKKEKGSISKERVVSGDKRIGDGDDKSRTVFDMIQSFDNEADSGLEAEDKEKILKRVFKMVDKQFPDVKSDGTKDITREVWYSFYGVNGHEKKSNKELAKKFNIEPSGITYYCRKVNNFLKNNSGVMESLNELYLMIISEQMGDNMEQSYKLGESRDYSNDFDNIQWKVDKWFESNGKSCIADILLKSILEMDNETQCRNSINTILVNEDALSKKYSVAIKSFVNFVNDNIDETANIDYADSIIKISKFIGKDKILEMFSHIKEEQVNPIDSIKALISSTNNEDKSLAVLLKYYTNHFDTLDYDKEDLSDTDIQKHIASGYQKVFGKNPDTPFEGLRELCKLIIDNEIEI